MFLKVSNFLWQVRSSLLLPLFLLVGLICDGQKLNFSHLGLDEGLTQETIHCITQDKNGFIWLGTSDGIVRYDGHDFFVPQIDNSSRLDVSGYRIGSILAHGNFVYIGTSQNGLLRYNILDESITQIGKDNANCTRLINYRDKVIATFYDSGITIIDDLGTCHSNNFEMELPKITGISALNDIVYVGTDNGNIEFASINNLDESGSKLFFKPLANLKTSINQLGTFNNTIWIMTNSGLYELDEERKSVKSLHIIGLDSNQLQLNISCVASYDNNYYIGTAANGLIIAEFEDNTLQVKQHYKASKKYDSSTINSDGINDLYISNNLLFIGNINLDITSIEDQEVFKQPTDEFNLDNPSVFAVYDTGKYLFTGSSSGLVISNVDNPSEYKILAEHDRVRGITKDNQNNIWFVSNRGAYLIPLENFSFDDPEILTLPIDANDTSKLPAENMRSVFKDRHGTIWITTFNSGFCKFTGNIQNRNFSFKKYGSDQLMSAFTLSMVEDSNGYYWMCTQKGLSKLKFTTDKMNLLKNYDETSGLATRGVLSAFVDSEDVIWVASRKGLNKYDPDSDRFTSFGKREGLTNTFVYNINEDDLGNLWLSTNGGLFRFDKTTEEFTNYNPKDGLQSTEFNLGATFKNEQNGKLYFGGINGLNSFDPSRIGKLDKEGTLKFTNLKIKDTYVLPDISNVIVSSFSTSSKINLNYDDFPVNMSFSGLDFRPNSNISYVYKLLPDDKEWNTLGAKNTIQLLNLSSKSYNLQIQGKSRNSLWQKPPLVLNIEVTPPWYKSNLAYILYILIFLSIVYAFYKISLQRQIAAQESKRLQDLDALKSRFTTNITHEFRTPLTIILGYLSHLKERFSNKHEVNTSLETIEQNSHNLLDLVNQMLDLAKFEKGQLDLNFIQNDISEFSERLIRGFNKIASDKSITIKFESVPNKIMMDFDAEKIRQILTNLISNAIKFSEENTTITISLEKLEHNTLKITVTDEGYGISESELPFIFDRFYQVDDSDHKISQGTGIGLALTKELVELLDGRIEATSAFHKGTTFTIHLPITNEAKIKGFKPMDAKTSMGIFVPQFDDIIDDEDSNSVLIVEDNTDMARYIASCLRPHYKVTFAKNGKEGFKLAQSNIPDLIITDVMMPIMNGFEMSKKLQSDVKTEHIPIVMLTSKALQEDKLEGISSGVDAYLTKPFHKKELLLRMQRLIEKRKKLQGHFKLNAIVNKQNSLDEAQAKTPKPDKNLIFLNSAIKIIEEHLDNSNFGAKELAKNMAMSDSQLYRKLKAVSNTSTAIFIRKVRLEKSKSILEASHLSISEVAYGCGFNDPNWYSKAFKNEYGVSPTEFRK